MNVQILNHSALREQTEMIITDKIWPTANVFVIGVVTVVVIFVIIVVIVIVVASVIVFIFVVVFVGVVVLVLVVGVVVVVVTIGKKPNQKQTVESVAEVVWMAVVSAGAALSTAVTVKSMKITID